MTQDDIGKENTEYNSEGSRARRINNANDWVFGRPRPSTVNSRSTSGSRMNESEPLPHGLKRGQVIHYQFPFGRHYAIVVDAHFSTVDLLVISTSTGSAELEECVQVMPGDRTPMRKECYIKCNEILRVRVDGIDNTFDCLDPTLSNLVRRTIQSSQPYLTRYARLERWEA